MVSLAAVGEFLLFRLLQPLLRLSPGIFPDWLSGSLIAMGTFSAHFAGVLSLCALLALLLVAMRERGIASHPMGRLGLGMMSLFFVSLASLEMLLPRFISASIGLLRAQWLLQTSSLCISVLLILAVLPRRTASRLHKIGSLLLLIPPLLLLESQWHIMGSRAFMQRLSLVLLVPGYGATLSAACLGLCSLLFLLGRPWNWIKDSLALMATSLVVGGMTMLLVLAPAAAARLIYIGFDLQLPHQPLAQGVYILSLASWSLSVGSLLLRHGALRLRGFGVLLVGLAGAQPRMIHQETFFLVGLLCLLESLLIDREHSSDAIEPIGRNL